jgi:hypothetical protein
VAYNQSRIKLFRRCQKAYSFRYDYDPPRELVPKNPKAALYRGTWLHALQEAHHRDWAGVSDDEDRPSVEMVMAKMVDQFNNLYDEEREEYGDIPSQVHRLFRTYLRYWKDDADRYEVATLHDGSPAIEFVVEVPLTKWGIEEPFKGRIDLMVEDKEYGNLWPWDAKWMSKIPAPDERMMSPQRLLYAWALKKEGYPVGGFVFNYGRTKEPTIPNVLKRNSKYGAAGYLTTKPSLDCDYWTYLDCIKETHGDYWREAAKTVYHAKLIELRNRHTLWFRRERVPVEDGQIKQAVRELIVSVRDIQRRNTKNPPRTYDYRCKWGCDYHDLCVGQFTGLDIEPLIKAQYTTEDERYGEDLEE